jgi:hypothetical protein
MPLYPPPSSGGALAIGAAIAGGTPGLALYEDAAGKLAQDASFAFDFTDKQLVLGNGTVGKPALICGDDTSGVWRPAADQLGWALGGVAAMGLGDATPDSDQVWTMGRARIDSRSTDIAYFGHRDMQSTLNYMAQQNANGQARFNAASGQSLTLRNNNSLRMTVDGTGIAFFSTAAGVAQSTGWAAITNPAVRKTFDTTTVTLQQLAEFVGTLSEYLKSLGLTAT